MCKSNDRPSQVFAYFLVITSALLLAVYSEAAHALDRDLDWQSAVLGRSLFGLFIVLPMAWSARTSMVFFHRTLMVRSALVAVFLIGFVYSASVVPPADIITVMSTQPLWIALISMFVFGAKYVKKFWFVSIALSIGVALLASAGTTDAVWIILIFTFLTMLRAIGTVMVLLLKDVPAIIQTVHLTLTMFILSALIFFSYGGHTQLSAILDVKGIVLLLTIGFTGTMYQLFSVKVIQSIGAIAGGIMPVIAVVFASVLDFLLWDDGINLPRFIGVIVVISSVSWLVCSRHLQRTIE